MNLEDINKIMTFEKDKDKNLIIEDKKIQKSKIRLGRKKKNSSEIGKHNKYSGDNLIRKCKGIILHYLYVLINNIIADNYKYDSNYNGKTKKLLKINQSQIINSDVNFNKEFLHKTLKDIFSDNITLRCSRFKIDHNKNLINSLLNEENKDKQNLFQNIFNLTFLDCLQHFRGSKTIRELKNLAKYEDICQSFEKDEDYLCSFRFYIENYEKIMENKKPRDKSKKRGKKIKTLLEK